LTRGEREEKKFIKLFLDLAIDETAAETLSSFASSRSDVGEYERSRAESFSSGSDEVASYKMLKNIHKVGLHNFIFSIIILLQ
jgi:hypothetical protein